MIKLTNLVHVFATKLCFIMCGKHITYSLSPALGLSLTDTHRPIVCTHLSISAIVVSTTLSCSVLSCTRRWRYKSLSSCPCGDKQRGGPWDRAEPLLEVCLHLWLANVKQNNLIRFLWCVRARVNVGLSPQVLHRHLGIYIYGAY